MDNCFVACGCDDNEGIAKGDLDRFTDKIENVLNDERGRKLFRNYMITCKMKDGRRALDMWEHIEKLLAYKGTTESISYRTHLAHIDGLIDEAERIDELDFAVIERLCLAKDSGTKEDIDEALKFLKTGVTKALRREYTAFRKHFIPTK